MFNPFYLLLLLGLLTHPESEKKPLIAEQQTQIVVAQKLYNDCGLKGLLSFDAFEKSLEGYNKYKPEKPIVAICDFSKPSDQKRFIVVDLENKKVLSNTYVAHGKNSGDLVATNFSNLLDSHKSCLGFFKIGAIVQSPKHGISLLLEGLEKGKNDNARAREIIMHGASYVCEKFIQQYGRLGRSFGCPALPQEVIAKISPVLANGGLLYIYR